MSITEVTTRITPQWLERKSKAELVSIIWANLDRIDIFATNGVGVLADLRKQHLAEAIRVIAHRKEELIVFRDATGHPDVRRAISELAALEDRIAELAAREKSNDRATNTQITD